MKKEIKKPNKYEIERAIDNSKDKVQELINGYEKRISEYIFKIVNFEKERNHAEADRYRERIKDLIARQTEMAGMYDWLEQTSDTINDAIATMEITDSLTNLTSKLNLGEMKSVLKQLMVTSETLSNTTKELSMSISSISKIANETSKSTFVNRPQDSQINAIIEARMEKYNKQIQTELENDESELFELNERN